MWDKRTTQQKERIIKEQLEYVEKELKRLYDYRELLEAEQLKLRLC